MKLPGETDSVRRDIRRPLHTFKAIHIDKNCEDISGFHENELFFNCTFNKVKGVTLKDCDLNQSKFLTSEIADALGFTISVGDCKSFSDVEYSPLLFDLMLVMLCKSKGNDEKRKKLIEVIGKERLIDLLQQMKRLE